MRTFARLLDRLSFTPGRKDKLRLMGDYFRTAPDPDRGWALAALTGTLPFSFTLRPVFAEIVSAHIDPHLYQLSRDYVGDTAETVALLWPDATAAAAPASPSALADIVATLELVGSEGLRTKLPNWLDVLDTTERWALLKLLTGGLRVGVSARLAKTALADIGARDLTEIEEVWHALRPPFTTLFDWILADGPRPETARVPLFRPMMLAHPLDESEFAQRAATDFIAEWKWDGIRVQWVADGGMQRLYSRTGDDISASFPEFATHLPDGTALDGELLVARDGEVAPFNELQQRLNRKAVSPEMLRRYPAHLRIYDALFLDAEDVRDLAWSERRQHLEVWHRRIRPARTDLSDVLAFPDWEALSRLRDGARAASIEGVMLKHRMSSYVGGRIKGHWYKWKRAPLTFDCVLMYAQRGSGKRSSYYSDYTFGAWRRSADGERELVPVGKAYSGFTDEELRALDRWIRSHSTERFGPVRRVAPELVLEVACDGVQRSTRHKSGVAMRFPRVHRIRWDKLATEADALDALLAAIPN